MSLLRLHDEIPKIYLSLFNASFKEIFIAPGIFTPPSVALKVVLFVLISFLNQL